MLGYEGVVTYYDSTVTGKSFRSMYFSVVTDNYDNIILGQTRDVLGSTTSGTGLILPSVPDTLTVSGGEVLTTKTTLFIH